MNLKELRKKARLTQAELAKLIGVNQNTYSYWENGKTKIDNATLAKLADYFNVTVDYLLGRTTASTAENKKTPDANATSVSDEEYSMILKYRMLSPLEKADVRGYINGKVSSSQNEKDEQLPQNVG